MYHNQVGTRITLCKTSLWILTHMSPEKNYRILFHGKGFVSQDENRSNKKKCGEREREREKEKEKEKNNLVTEKG